MAQTPKLALPYPVATDPANGPAGFQSLATAVEASVVPGTVTSLPGAPYDGQVINYLADATNGIVWRLRYRSTAPAPYRWEFIGGSQLLAEVLPGVNLSGPASGSNYMDIPGSPGPTLTMPLAGDYELEFGATVTWVSGVTPVGMAVGVARGATAPVTGGETYLQPMSGLALPAYRTTRVAVSAAQLVLTERYWLSAATTVQLQTRVLRARPVRVVG